MPERFDIAILGGGPAGSTCGSLIRKYNPDLRVAILERERFPREHVGESQLPPILRILNEMGVWEKVENAGFPIKLGATYRWGTSTDLWDFNFIAPEEVQDLERPGTPGGLRDLTAWHVDRAQYDTILLDHAAELGCDVRQETKIASVVRDEDDSDKIIAVETSDGSRIEADWFVDATGEAGVIRRAMDVGVESPALLKNIAMWNYWRDAEWAVRIGKDVTRVLVLSISCGWLWYIPIGEDRISVGFVCPAEYYKKCGKTPAELYAWAVEQEPLVRELLENAEMEGETKATKDWSFVADRLYGSNWFLAGDSGGFADPILAAGLTLTHSSAREVAYALLEMFRGEHDPAWLKERYEDVQRTRVKQHIRFADFWYAGNGIFTDIEVNTREIAKKAGLKLNEKDAFRWLANGGFSRDTLTTATLVGVDFSLVKRATEKLTGKETSGALAIAKYNKFMLNLNKAEQDTVPLLANGRITPTPCFVRDDKLLPVSGYYALVIEALKVSSAVHEFVPWMAQAIVHSEGPGTNVDLHMTQAFQVMEAMLIEGWIWGQIDRKAPMFETDPGKPLGKSIVPDAGERVAG